MAFIRKVKTAKGATAVQIAFKEHGRIVRIEHIGSAHTEAELESLVALARQHLRGDQLSLFAEPVSPLKIILKRSVSSVLLQVLREQYRVLGFDLLEDEIFAYLCIARIVEPTSKLDSLRVLAELGVTRLDRNQMYRCLGQVITQNYRVTVTNQ